MAEDITQESFVRLWQKHEAFSCQQSIKAFLYIITRNACLNFIKHWQCQKKKQEMWAFTWDETEDHILNKLTRTDAYGEVYSAINNLPTECRKIIILSYIEGFRNQEIAEQLHLSINTVKNQKSRGLYLLKKKLLPSLEGTLANSVLERQ
jgi:RNA polymerase sigma-70 factor (ECF subfamily)